MIEAVKIKTLILILMVGILFTVSNLIPLVNAQPIPTSLSIAIPSPPTENECIIEATLKDENGNPIPNMDIDFYFCGRDKIGTNNTCLEGIASLKLSDDLPFFSYPRLELFETKITRTWKISAVFKGTTNYVQSSSNDVYVAFVFIDYTPYIVGGGILTVAIIGVVGYFVFRRSKKTITPPKITKEMTKKYCLGFGVKILTQTQN